MVRGTAGRQSEVVVGGNGVDHIHIHRVVGCQLQALRNDLPHVGLAVRLVKGGVLRQNVLLDEMAKRGVDG